MRESLFKGKRVYNGQWVQGDVSFHPENGRCWISVWEQRKGYDEQTYLSHISYEVIPETVGQFTGLKDKNKNRIFEGHKLYVERFGNVVVFFNEDVSAFQFKYIAVQGNELSATLYEFQSHEYEITGNIHDK